MKNVIIIAAIISMGFSFQSCKRVYTCSCKSAWDGKWYDQPVEANSRKQANTDCLALIAPEVDGPSACTLKP